MTLDHESPWGQLVYPIPESTIGNDEGFVEVEWVDQGDAGLDADSFGPNDITIDGVTVDSIQEMGNGLVRYIYDADGDVLTPDSTVTVTWPAGHCGPSRKRECGWR